MHPSAPWFALSTWEGRLWFYEFSAEIGLRPVATYKTRTKETFWPSVSPTTGHVAVPLNNGQIQVFAPPSDPSWKGLVSRARRLSQGRLTRADERELGLAD